MNTCAYLIHARPISDSRFLLDFFTKSHGLVKMVGRRPSKVKQASWQSFIEYDIEFMGARDLKTLTRCDAVIRPAGWLLGRSLYCGFYVNELIQRLWPQGEPNDELYDAYQSVLNQLHHFEQVNRIEIALRQFEFCLIQELGYEVSFNRCARSGQTLKSAANYAFELGVGLTEVQGDNVTPWTCEAEVFLAIAQRQWDHPKALNMAKLINRKALTALLGKKPLKSRELFLEM